ESIDDIGDGLIVRRRRHDHGRIAAIQRSADPQSRHRRKQERRLAGPRRTIDSDDIAWRRRIEPGQNLALLFGKREMRVGMTQATCKCRLYLWVGDRTGRWRDNFARSGASGRSARILSYRSRILRTVAEASWAGSNSPKPAGR